MIIPAKLVRAVGGPMGPAVGPAGPPGFPSMLLAGAMGRLGPFGRPGATGPAGPVGLFLDLAGPTGAKGPLGSTGLGLCTGPTGTGKLVPDSTHSISYRNTQGFTNIPSRGAYMGCACRYQIKGNGYTFIFFTGQYTSTSNLQMDIGMYLGWGAAPNAGDSGASGTGGMGGGRGDPWVRIIAPAGTKIPFFIMSMEEVSGWDYQDAIFPIDRWYDLGASIGTSTFDPPGGIIDNITCSIFEVRA